MKKMILFAAAGLLSTASIVYATIRADKKPATVKKETAKKVHKCNWSSNKCGHYCMGAM